jgi:transposase-like protein
MVVTIADDIQQLQPRMSAFQQIVKNYDLIEQRLRDGVPVSSLANVLGIKPKTLSNALAKIRKSAPIPVLSKPPLEPNAEKTKAPQPQPEPKPATAVVQAVADKPSELQPAKKTKNTPEDLLKLEISNTAPSDDIEKNRDALPPIPTDWPMVRKKVNGKETELYQSPKFKLYSVLPGVDPDAPYGRNEVGVSYNLFGGLTRSMIGKGFIGEDL